MLGKAANPLLEKAEQAIQSKVQPQYQSGLSKMVHAGLLIMYDPSLKPQMMQKISASTNPAQEAAQGSAMMVARLFKMSKNTIPAQLFAPAAMVFAFEYLDVVAKAGKAQITPQLIADTTQAVGDALMQAMGVSKDKLAQMVQQAKAKQGIVGAQRVGA